MKADPLFLPFDGRPQTGGAANSGPSAVLGIGSRQAQAAREDLGAFYTEGPVVRFLASWGMRVPRRRIFDPSCGDGRFLEAAFALPQVRRLGTLGSLADGRVTGDDDFFHRTRKTAIRRGLPETWLRPAARSSRSLKGALVTRQDMDSLEEAGAAHHLLADRVAGRL